MYATTRIQPHFITVIEGVRVVTSYATNSTTESIYRRYSIVDDTRLREEAAKLKAWATGAGAEKPATTAGRVRQFKRQA